MPSRHDGALRACLHAGDHGRRGRDRPRHRALLVGLGLGRPTRRRPPAGAAHHLRPARAPGPSPAAPPLLQSEGRRPARAGVAPVLPPPHRQPGRGRDGRRRGGLRPAHPGARHLPAARHPRSGRRHLPRLDLPQLPAGTPRQPRARRGQRRDDRLHPRLPRRPAGRTGRRPPVGGGPRHARRRTRAGGPAARVHQADDPRRHRHDLERHRRRAVALRAASRRPGSPGRRADRGHALDDGDRGGPPLPRTGDDGPQGHRRHGGRRLPGAGGRAGAA